MPVSKSRLSKETDDYVKPDERPTHRALPLPKKDDPIWDLGLEIVSLLYDYLAKG